MAAGGGGLPDLTPLIGPVAAIETVRERPAGPVAFAHAKLVHVMAGTARIHTAVGSRVVAPGDVIVLGGRIWCHAVPMPRVRAFTIYIDEDFLRQHVGWAIPPDMPLRQGVQPQMWDGQPLFLRPGVEVLGQLEPVLRQMSAVPAAERVSGVAELMTLFARAVELVVPTIVETAASDSSDGAGTARLVTAEDAQVAAAVQLLREDLAHPWGVDELAGRVALSRSQLTRLFARHAGLAPMRLLGELRLTEFTRLVEETELSVAAASTAVGWDRRTALRWFSRRHGINPSQFRRQPAASLAGETPCLLCGHGAGVCAGGAGMGQRGSYATRSGPS